MSLELQQPIGETCSLVIGKIPLDGGSSVIERARRSEIRSVPQQHDADSHRHGQHIWECHLPQEMASTEHGYSGTLERQIRKQGDHYDSPTLRAANTPGLDELTA